MARSSLLLQRLLIASSLLLGLTSAGQFQLSNGDIVEFDKNDGGFADASAASRNQKRHDGSMSPRHLFGRQYCSSPGANIICGTGCCFNYKLCCERENCFDPSFDKCCSGGGACPRTGECCQDNKCCSAGTYCIRDLDTNQIRCRSSGSGSTPTTIRASISSIASITPAPSVSRPAASLSCYDAGYTACAGNRFCCPSSAYCFYNTLSQPRCYTSAYYYLTWTYSYSYSFGIRYFRTTTRYYLGGDGGVPVVTTPAPPTTPPPTSLALTTGVTTTSSRSTTTAAPSTGTIASGSSLLGGATEDGGSPSSSSSSASSASASASAAAGSASRTISGLSGSAGTGSRATLLGDGWGVWVLLGQGVAIVLGIAVLA